MIYSAHLCRKKHFLTVNQKSIIHLHSVHAEAVSYFGIKKDSTAQGLPYDFDSCMQFSYDAYSKNKLSTILPKDLSLYWGAPSRANWPSEQDYVDINLTYCGKTLHKMF